MDYEQTKKEMSELQNVIRLSEKEQGRNSRFAENNARRYFFGDKNRTRS